MRVARKPIRSFEFRVIARRRDVEPRCYKLEPASTKRAHIRRVCTPLYFSTILTLSLPLSLISSLLLFFRCYFIDDSCGNHAKPSILHRHVCTAQEQNASYTRARSSILLRPETTCAQKQTRTKRRESRELRSPRNTTRGIKRYRVEEGVHVLLKRERTGCWDCVKRMTAAWLETEW